MLTYKWGRCGLVIGICFTVLVSLSAMQCDRQAGSTGQTEPNGELNTQEKTLLQIARQYLSQHRPGWNDVDDLQPRIVEYDGYWKVTWDLPGNMLGGAPVLHIDKSSHEVIGAYHEQ